MSAKDMAHHLLEGVISYLSTHPQTSLTAVDVVIFQPSMVRDFVSTMKNAIEKKYTWDKSSNMQLSQWFVGVEYKGDNL